MLKFSGLGAIVLILLAIIFFMCMWGRKTARFRASRWGGGGRSGFDEIELGEIDSSRTHGNIASVVHAQNQFGMPQPGRQLGTRRPTLEGLLAVAEGEGGGEYAMAEAELAEENGKEWGVEGTVVLARPSISIEEKMVHI